MNGKEGDGIQYPHLRSQTARASPSARARNVLCHACCRNGRQVGSRRSAAT